MDINEKLKLREENIINSFVVNQPIEVYCDDPTFAFDIEACYLKEKNEMLTYSIAVMSCNNNTDLMYWYNSIDNFLKALINIRCKKATFIAHNTLYDIKPILLKLVENYNIKQYKQELKTKKVYNNVDNRNETLKFGSLGKRKLDSNVFDLSIKDGVFYKLKLQTETTEITFLDSYKILPMSLQKACTEFLGLNLSKTGLDYNIVRDINDKLTNEEMCYIYEDVYGLSYLIKMVKIDGIDINEKHIIYSKITSSSQAMEDYKKTLEEDFILKQNAFKDDKIYNYVDDNLLHTKYYATKSPTVKREAVFNSTYPHIGLFNEKWLRFSYYGGLCTPCYENIEKYKNNKNHNGIVLDVNSLYPYIMTSRLLPYGDSYYRDKPYKDMSEEYKNERPLYTQEITIYDFEVKKNKMPFIQVKNNKYFNGREIVKNNTKGSKKITIILRLCKPLFELLFECYDVKSYELGGHMAFRGANDLFDNYISFWKKVKETSTGAKRAIAKLRQNGLYGKFGMNNNDNLIEFKNDNGKFTIEKGEEYIGSSVYLPMATFITSYAKQYLVQAINANYERFLYCDTDSLHLYGTLEEVKGVNIGKNTYGYWDNEMCFNDYKYLSPKRYAEKDIETNKWVIKCCGLTDSIMEQVKDINVFDVCEYDVKTVKKLFKENKIYVSKNPNDVYYYKDEECTEKIKGLIKSKKSKVVRYGTNISEQPYMITKNYFL
ncbi:MAG: DNA polymerase [Bacilli bacterium]